MYVKKVKILEENRKIKNMRLLVHTTLKKTIKEKMVYIYFHNMKI